jgi:hypothetical protein
MARKFGLWGALPDDFFVVQMTTYEGILAWRNFFR